MNPWVLFFADGTIYFVGLILLYLGLCLSLRLKAKFPRKLCQILAITGVLLVLIYSTPMPWWAFSVWLWSVGAGFFALRKPAGALRAEYLLGWTTLLLILLEAPCHRAPRIPIPEGGTLYVLGDSLSAGMGMGETPWPEVLDGMLPNQVVNLARPGAVTADGLRQAEFHSAEPATVLIALGGNDVMDQTPLKSFRNSLDALMTSLTEQGHSLILLETPLYPFQGKYGRAQRQLARKHDAVLLPKRLITRTLGQPYATLDGLHLSDTGHRHLSQQIAEHIRIRGQ